jgi:DNA-directed RNA polymerase sigma subunit (sigma70/sigma32)
MKCFEACEKYKSDCKRSECRHWIENKKSRNCTLIASKSGPMTLQEIGDVFGVTRMRICQLEKKILKKIEFIINCETNR